MASMLVAMRPTVVLVNRLLRASEPQSDGTSEVEMAIAGRGSRMATHRHCSASCVA